MLFGLTIGGGFYLTLLLLLLTAQKVGVGDINYKLLGSVLLPICTVIGVLAYLGLKFIINSAINQKVAETNKGQVTGEQVTIP